MLPICYLHEPSEYTTQKNTIPSADEKNTTKRRGLCIDFVSVGGGPFYSEISRETNIGRFGRIFLEQEQSTNFIALRPSLRASSGEIEGSYV